MVGLGRDKVGRVWELQLARGCNRIVLLIGPYALKFPRPSSWHNLLYGLLNNIHEAAWSRSVDGACPVMFRLPGGWLNVMPRCEILTEDEFAEFDAQEFCKASGLRVEQKADSFGRLRGKIVAVDYGW